MKRLLVLGGGTAGTMVVNKLRRRLDRARVADHRRRPERQPPLPAGLPVHPVRHLPPERGGQATPAVHPERGRPRPGRDRPGRRRRRTRCCWPTAGAAATTTWSSPPAPRRARTRPRACSAREWRQEHLRLLHPRRRRPRWREALRDVRPGGRLVVHITEMPIKCPVAPLEFTFLADAFFRRAGHARPGRDRLRHPADGRVHQAGRRPRTSASMLDERKIAVETDFMVERDRRRGARRWSPTTSARSRSTCW